MSLDDRKKRILQAIIDGYVSTAEPVGSRTIAKKYELGLSSATIRNEMADLEEMGYIQQPHTSAGRVPSDKGYRFYVDELMPKHQFSTLEINTIYKELELKINEINQLIKRASILLSRATKYTSVAITPQVRKSIIKSIQLVFIDQFRVLVVIVTDAGIVESNIARIGSEISFEYTAKVTCILNDKLCGLAIEDITQDIIIEIENLMGAHKTTLAPILTVIFDSISAIDNSESDVYLDGTTNMLNFPEYSDINKVREIMAILDAKEILYTIFNSKKTNYPIDITIGNENNVDEIKDCAIITATYNLGEKPIGKIGVIGPMRMEYSYVVSYVEQVRNVINREIDRIIRQLNGEE